MSKQRDIYAIAIDFGAKQTGVYYANYREGTYFSEIKKSGETLKFEKYTALLKERTAARHIRRVYARRKMAKRLISLALQGYFNFPIKKHTQAIGFFLNRRGFNRLEMEYSEDRLNEFSVDAWDKLPSDSQKILQKYGANPDADVSSGIVKLAHALRNIAEQGIDTIEQVYTPIEKQVKDLKKELVYYSFLNKLLESVKRRIDDKTLQEEKKERQRLSQTANWIVNRWIKEGISHLPNTQTNRKHIDIIQHLNDLKSKQYLIAIKDSIPADREASIKKLKGNEWNFNIEKFNLEEIEEKLAQKAEESYGVKTDLHHLSFALHKIYAELESGGRHRTKYFFEIERDLNAINNHSPRYLHDFAQKIENHTDLDKQKFLHLVYHISNFELKPLRVYFNEEDYKKDSGGDQWDLEKISNIFNRWILKQWRVTENDGAEKEESYQKLKKQ